LDKDKLSFLIRIPLTKVQKEALKKSAKMLGFRSMSAYVRYLLIEDLRNEGYLKKDDD
jgi:hypothetical protein